MFARWRLLREQMREIEAKIEALVEVCPEALALTSVPEISTSCAATIVAELGTPETAACDHSARAVMIQELERAVLVQPSVYGTDNTVMLGAMNELGADRCRGVAVVDSAVPDTELERLHEAGVQLGVLSNGDSEMLETALVTSGLHRYIDLVLSADQVRAVKTMPSVDALGPRAVKLQAPSLTFFFSKRRG